MRIRVAAGLILVAGTSAAFGQDSVSRNANGGNGLPGDALSPWTTSLQRTSFVVDLTEFRTASGARLGIAPALKSGRVSSSRFNALNAAVSISQAVAAGAAYPSASYSLWTQPGGGLNGIENNTALNTTVVPTGAATVFGLAFLDVDEALAGPTAVLANHVIGAQVAFDPADPGRLFVTRVVGASNSSASTQVDRSQFGVGSIDAEGNLCIRADGFGVAATGTTPLQGENYFRIRLPARTATVNVIDNAGGSNAAATDWLLMHGPVMVAVPAAIPTALAGRSVLTGADFVGLLSRESSPGVLTATTTHRPGSVDHRGSAAISGRSAFAGSVATGAIVTRSTAGGGKPDSISVFGLDAGGQVVAARTVTIPGSVVDGCDAFSWPLSGGAIRGYDSQVTFRGGVGPAAVGVDQAGRVLAAATAYQGATPDPMTPFNAIAAARFDPASPTSPVQWTLVAWVDSMAMTGKFIRGDYGQDGAPGTGDAGEGDGVVDGLDAPIGRLASLNETSLGLSGPSLSSPAFDSAGNVYFIASAAFNRLQGQQVIQEFDIGLFRAVYDPAAFCYTLDLVLRNGSVYDGENSGRRYQVQTLALADSDSVSSAALWASSTTQQAWNNVPAASLAPADPVNLGGLAVAARIVYDTNGDGLYRDPTAVGGDPASPDESYNVVLYVGNITQPPPTCDPDYNQDGNSDQDDVAYLINVIGGGPNPTGRDPDFNGDGNADQDDVGALINVVAGGPCP